ncbi:hypothetical protein [Clostridium perfringens]|uniref:Uncharacterized protein n=1 Tax=Clostridium perfringens TaxID=1502 RepID=A0A140GRZ2_CLOPF|nr:hypothetical protein [Clostridium perfringens]AMN31301.1 hypothetical protein JFP838_pA0385 [Clostridium perfringens]
MFNNNNNILGFKDEHVNLSQKDINWKSFKWILLFFPYGIYYMFKNKAFNRPLRWFIVILITLLTISIADTLINPDRVLNSQVEQFAKDFVNEHKEMGGFGEIDEIKDDYRGKNYRKYFLYTSVDKYLIYVDIINNKSEVEGVYQVGKKSKTIYQTKSLDMPKDILPSIYFFIKENEKTYGTVKEAKKCLYPYQEITTSNGNYLFVVDYGRVIKIYNIEGNNRHIIYEVQVDELILPEFNKILKTNKYGPLQEVLAYDLEKDGQVEYFRTDKGHYKFKKSFDGTITVYK